MEGAMTTVRLLVQSIEADQRNAEGGRSITMMGQRSPSGDPHHVVVTFATAADFKKLRGAIDSD
jgi:hypothetical protein